MAQKGKMPAETRSACQVLSFVYPRPCGTTVLMARAAVEPAADFDMLFFP